MKKNILVFPSASNLAIEIFYSLSKDKNINLIGCSSLENEITKIFKENIVIREFIGDINFVEKINKIIKKHNIDLIYPLSDDVDLYFSKNKEKFNCGILCSFYETSKILRSKKDTYEYFKNIINVPVIWNNINKIKKFPVFIKPKKGSSSKDCFIANNRKELDFLIKKIEDPIISEYLSGQEFTVDCFTDFNGNLLFCQPRLRIFKTLGASSYTKLISNEILKLWSCLINKSIKFNGAWFFQTKLNENQEQTLLEIAPRIGASSGINRFNDVNLPLLNVYNYYKKKIDIYPNEIPLTGYRYLNYKFDFNLYYHENIYFDFDDTILINEKLNSDLMKFLFECLNEKINVYIISKHKGDLIKKLKNLKIINLFKGIIHLKSSDIKANHMKEKSILIDDSFSERKEARDKGFLAFPPDAFY